MWIVQNSHLHRVDPQSGNWLVLGGPVWGGSNSMTAIWHPGSEALFIIQNGILHRVSPFDGTWSVLGEDWGGRTVMTAVGDSLFIIQEATLHKVNPVTGDREVLGAPEWAATTSMATLWYPTERIFAIQNNYIHEISPLDGTWRTVGNPEWDGCTSMTALGTELFVIQNSFLHKVNPHDGSYIALGEQVWEGAAGITALRDPGNEMLFVIQNAYLHRVRASDGDWATLGGPEWGGPSLMMQTFLPSGRTTVPTPTPGPAPEPEHTFRINLGTHSKPNGWRFCPSGAHLLGDTRREWVEVWAELRHSTFDFNSVQEILLNCARVGAVFALLAAIATDGAAVPSATAAFITAFKRCLVLSAIGAIADQFQFSIHHNTHYEDWSGHSREIFVESEQEGKTS